MATPRKENKKNDGDRTKQELLEAVHDYVTQYGFAGLTAVKLGRMIGKDRNCVRYHFGSLNGLLEAYIRREDFWIPFFEKFMLPQTATEVEVRQMFVDMMQAGYDAFSADHAMQNIICKQASDDSPLMQKLSAERERNGAPLLELAQRYFKDKEEDFAAVMAVVLGGIYYLVPHARNNRSTVFGLDLNTELSKDRIRNAIARIIENNWIIKN